MLGILCHKHPCSQAIFVTSFLCHYHIFNIFQVALYLRRELNIRTCANFIIAVAASHAKCRPYLRKYFNDCIVLPSDWINVAEFYVVKLFSIYSLERHIWFDWAHNYSITAQFKPFFKFYISNIFMFHLKNWNEIFAWYCIFIIHPIFFICFIILDTWLQKEKLWIITYCIAESHG